MSARTASGRGRAGPGGEALAFRHPRRMGAIGILAPIEEGFRQIGLALPVSGIHQPLQASTIGPGFRAEDAVAGLQGGLRFRCPVANKAEGIGSHTR